MSFSRKSSKTIRAAAAKFDEGRQVGKSEVVSKYLELMSQAYQKRADAEEARRKAACPSGRQVDPIRRNVRSHFVEAEIRANATPRATEARATSAKGIRTVLGLEHERTERYRERASSQANQVRSQFSV